MEVIIHVKPALLSVLRCCYLHKEEQLASKTCYINPKVTETKHEKNSSINQLIKHAIKSGRNNAVYTSKK